MESPEVEQEDKPVNIQFRITGEQAKTMTRLANMLFKKGVIKTNSIPALIKACAFTQVNLYLQMEAREEAYKQRITTRKRQDRTREKTYCEIPKLRP